MNSKSLTTPLTEKAVLSLHSGDAVLLSGVIYTARDAAHQRLSQLLDQGKALPLSLAGQLIYYAGPAPTPPGKAVGSIGPTTAGRMDAYTPVLLAHGLKAMLGKGRRSPEVRRACQEQKAVYLAALGGAAALMAQKVKSCELVAWPELGAEAIYRLEVEELPAFVINDCYGGDLYEEIEGKAK